MKAFLDIYDFIGKKNLFNQISAINMLVEYAVPNNNLCVCYISNDGKQDKSNILKIDHIVYGQLSANSITFFVTIGVVFNQGELFHVIINQESNDANFALIATKRFDDYDTGDYTIIKL